MHNRFLHNVKRRNIPFNVNFGLNFFLFSCIFLLFYICLPIYLAINLKLLSFKVLFVFYFFNLLAIGYLFNKNLKVSYRLKLKIQDIQEKLNILQDQNLQEINNKASLEEKIRRYASLKNIIEKINKDFDIDCIAGSVTDIAFSLIGANKGVGILYLVDNQSQKIVLLKTKKEDKKLVIKAKEGDIFDFWVLRHAGPLLVEDAGNDFRFDLEKVKKQDTRPILSLIISPFISENRFLGILRLDRDIPGFYSQDDLRFLVAISDIAAVALENAELFQKTQDLAIHDSLTSFYTKVYFRQRLKDECKRSIVSGIPLSLLMLDIDYFKNYNDKFGHTSGDIVLKNLSSNIQNSLKDCNFLISRFGGEEFCVALLGKDKGQTRAIAEELRAQIEKMKINLRRQDTGITVSIGLASFAQNITDEDELIRKADLAMYEAKQKGRNRVVSA